MTLRRGQPQKFITGTYLCHGPGLFMLCEISDKRRFSLTPIIESDNNKRVIVDLLKGVRNNKTELR